jgi:hypothetical protein
MGWNVVTAGHGDQGGSSEVHVTEFRRIGSLRGDACRAAPIVSPSIAPGWRNDPRSLYASPRPQPALAALGEIAMRTEQQIEAAAAAAAEKANGSKFTAVELFAKSFASGPETYKQLDALHQRMKKLRAKILPARHKLGAHADRDVIRKGRLLGKASFEEWDDFWSALRDFVRILNEKTTGKPFEIDAGGVFGDAEMLIKALGQSRHFETLLNGSDKAVADACLKLALPNG